MKKTIDDYPFVTRRVMTETLTLVDRLIVESQVLIDEYDPQSVVISYLMTAATLMATMFPKEHEDDLLPYWENHIVQARAALIALRGNLAASEKSN